MSRENWTSDSPGRAYDEDFRRAVEDEIPALERLSRRLAGSGSDADDALQDALERAWRGRGQLRSRESLGGWLRSILARSLVDIQRRRRATPIGTSEDVEQVMPDVQAPLEVVEAAGDELRLRAALHELAPSDRLVLVLHDAEGWNASAIGELLGVGADATHKRLQRARARLLSELAGARAGAPAEPACRDARLHAHELLEGSLDDATRSDVEQHLEGCPRCPATLQAAVGVLEALRDNREGGLEPSPRSRALLASLVREGEAAG